MNAWKRFSTFGLFFLVSSTVNAQTPSGTPHFTVAPAVSVDARELAFASMLEGQRYLILSANLRSQSAIADATRRAKAAFQHAVDLDPTLAEGFTALAEIAVIQPPNDVDEGIRLASKAVEANPRNYGGRLLLARLNTFKSRLNNGPLDPRFARLAVDAWNEVTRLDPRSAEAWAFLAEFCDKAGKKEDRIAALRKWVASDPPLDTEFFRQILGPTADLSPESGSVRLGQSLIEAGRNGEAVTVLSEAAANNPENVEAIELLRDAVSGAEQKFAPTVIRSLQQAIYTNPGNRSLLLLLAEVYERDGRIVDGEKLLRDGSKTVSRNDPSSGSILLVSLGDLLSRASRPKEARAVYEETLALRGIAKTGPLTSEDREFAKLVFEKIILADSVINDPEHVLLTIDRARRLFGGDDLFADRQLIAYYRLTGKPQAALDLVRGIRQRYPRDQSFVRQEATILVVLGRIDEAVDIVNTSALTALVPSMPITVSRDGSNTIPPTAFDQFSNLLFLTGLYSDAGRGKDAAATARKALEVAGNDDRKQIAEMTLASALQTSGDFADAEVILRELLKRLPGNPIALNNLGYFLAERNVRLDEALGLVQAALKIDPTNPSYLDSLGWIYFKNGNLVEAEKQLRYAARFDSSSVTIHEHLGDVLKTLGREKEAREAWQQALDLANGTIDSTRLRQKLH